MDKLLLFRPVEPLGRKFHVCFCDPCHNFDCEFIKKVWYFILERVY